MSRESWPCDDPQHQQHSLSHKYSLNLPDIHPTDTSTRWAHDEMPNHRLNLETKTLGQSFESAAPHKQLP